uniref:Armadillo type fold n=1 Tax=Echinococcus granulosus TaxID=6210 RepID=A0A068WLS1_ECHGR|nr:Armadillo type fold [Echinococcus granulosus]
MFGLMCFLQGNPKLATMAPMRQDSATFNMTCLLREWDRAPRERRRQLLQNFIDQHWNRSGPELELELAQMASLFLARICVWVKLTYMSGTCLTEQLQVLYIFLSAASSHNFLAEFLQNGGILCLQELCVLPGAKEVDKYWALRVLSCVANGGTRYKETICECYGIRAVAECMAKSRSERTQEAARDVLEQLAEGNPRFRDQVYKGLIAVLPCDSAKAQQLALQSIRILQIGNPVANRALIDRVNCIMESLHFSVQAAALELVRTLMECDIADDILKALVRLLHPQREIELGKLFNEATKSISDSSDEDDNDFSETVNENADDPKKPAGNDGVEEDEVGTMDDGRLIVARPIKTMRRRVGGRASRRVSSYTTSSRSSSQHRRSRHPRRGKDGSASSKASIDQTFGKTKDLDDDQAVLLPTPAFVQQASAAKCIGVLIEDSVDLTKRLLSLGALSGLLYAMGNLEYPDSQRHASLAVKMLCERYLPIREIVSQVMGQALYEEFFKNTDEFYLRMTPLQADLLVSSKAKFAGIDEISLEKEAAEIRTYIKAATHRAAFAFPHPHQKQRLHHESHSKHLWMYLTKIAQIKSLIKIFSYY